MALFRLGFFSGAWSPQTYRRVAFWGFVVCIPLYIPLIYWNDVTGSRRSRMQITEALHLSLLRPWLTLAHASLVVLFTQSGAARWLAERLVAAGRMAFSNYLGTSIVVTLFFNGYGLGWYGYFERWQCYLVVPVVWALILLWSRPWLEPLRLWPVRMAVALARARRAAAAGAHRATARRLSWRSKKRSSRKERKKERRNLRGRGLCSRLPFAFYAFYAATFPLLFPFQSVS